MNRLITLRNYSGAGVPFVIIEEILYWSILLKDSDYITSESFIVFLLLVLILILFSFLPQTRLLTIYSKTATLTASKLHKQVDPYLILCKAYFLSRSGLPVEIWSAFMDFSFSVISLKPIIWSLILIPLRIRRRIRIYLLARRNLLWAILRLPSSRRAALGLYVILTLWRGRGANQPPYALLHRSSPRYALHHRRRLYT